MRAHRYSLATITRPPALSACSLVLIPPYLALRQAVCEAGQYCRLQSFDPDTLTAMGSTTSTYTLTLGSCAGGGVDGDTTTCSNGVVVDAAGQAVNVSTLDTQVLTESEYAALSDIEYVVDTATGHIKTEKVEDEEGERTVREVAYDAEVHGPKCDGEGKPSGYTQTTSARQRAAKVLSTTSLLCCGDDLCNSASRTGSLGAAGLAIAAAAMAGFALQTTRV